MISRLTPPMMATSGFMCRRLFGISASSSSGSLPSGFTPRATCACLLRMMTPMAASMPCTALLGKKSPKRPAFMRPSRKSSAPLTTTAASMLR